MVSEECPVCNETWTRRVPLNYAPYEIEMEYPLPEDGIGYSVCITEKQLYIHIEKK